MIDVGGSIAGLGDLSHRRYLRVGIRGMHNYFGAKGNFVLHAAFVNSYFNASQTVKDYTKP
jgi:hypothetical protein